MHNQNIKSKRTKKKMMVMIGLAKVKTIYVYFLEIICFKILVKYSYYKNV